MSCAKQPACSAQVLAPNKMTATLPLSLYHYTKKGFADDFVKRGIISFGNAASYDEDHLTIAQRDREYLRAAVLAGDKVKLRAGKNYASSIEIKNLMSLKFEVRLPPYFLKCMTTATDDRFYSEFKADTCVAIRKPHEFLLRLSAALDQGQLLGDWRIIADLANYKKDDEIPPQEEEKQFFIKRMKFRWQNEFRIVLWPRAKYTPESKGAREQLLIGPLTDICEIK
jgi:hypothetical protein